MLQLLQPGIQPLGQFDGYDSDFLTLKGGEVVTLISVPSPGQPGVSAGGYDHAAYDVFDGYTNPGGVQKRPAVTRSLSVGKRPLFLADEGISGYGTLLGAVLGGTVGQQINNPSNVVSGYTGAVLGPHTATGSGKVTCWDKPGLYMVSLDACDQNASTGLQPTNTTIDTGSPLYAANSSYSSGAGVLTPNSAVAFESVVVGRFIEFNTNHALVTTPNYLVAALNSPSGNVSSVGPRQFQFATFTFLPPS